MSPAHTATVNIYDAKTRLSKLVSEVEGGAEITISRNGRPVARLVPYRATTPDRKPGAWRGQVVIADDFDDFTPDDEREWFGA